MVHDSHPDCHLLIMGDFNLTLRQIGDLDTPIAKTLMGLHVRNPIADIPRNGGNVRTIDHMMSTKQPFESIAPPNNAA